jgi:hypothetical protein
LGRETKFRKRARRTIYLKSFIKPRRRKHFPFSSFFLSYLLTFDSIMKYTLLTGALLLAGYATAVPMIPSQPYSEGYVSPMYSAPDADILKDSYIVVLKDNLHPTKIEEHTSWVTQLTNNNSPWTQWLHPSSSSHGVRHVYDRPTLKGYSGKFDSDTLNAIRASEDVSINWTLACLLLLGEL